MIRAYKEQIPKIAASCYIDPGAQVIGDVTLGENVSLWPGVVLRGDVSAIRIAANSNIQDGSVLHGYAVHGTIIDVELGENVTIGHSVTLHACKIEDRCLIGIGAIVLTGARIGHDSIIAAGTLVPEHAVVEPGSLWMGLPGKFRRAVTDAEKAEIVLHATRYVQRREEYLMESSRSSEYGSGK
jgi:carbonic anhydrase/acetyltransferase-like protein (isoleucine patch superfamily)